MKIFNAHAIVAACAAAKARAEAQSKSAFPDNEEKITESLESAHHLSSIFSIDFVPRSFGRNGTKYLGPYCRLSETDKRERLMVRISDELHVGQIAPLDEDELVRVNEHMLANQLSALKLRVRNPTMNVQKYIAPLVDGEPLPPTSVYHKMIGYLEEYLLLGFERRILDGDIVTEDDEDNEGGDALVVACDRLIPVIQRTVSRSAASNPGLKLDNPIIRITLKFSDAEKPMKTKYYDWSQPFIIEGNKKRLPLLELQGRPVDTHNVHLITSFSRMSGLIDLGSVWLSNMGISVCSPTLKYCASSSQ